MYDFKFVLERGIFFEKLTKKLILKIFTGLIPAGMGTSTRIASRGTNRSDHGNPSPPLPPASIFFSSLKSLLSHIFGGPKREVGENYGIFNIIKIQILRDKNWNHSRTSYFLHFHFPIVLLLISYLSVSRNHRNWYPS